LAVNQTGEGADGVLEFKGRMMTLSVLRLLTDDISALRAELKRRLARTPDFFQRMPLLLEPVAGSPDLVGVAEMLRGLGLVPVAVYQPSPALAEAAREAGLGVISDARAAPSEDENRKAPAGPPATATENRKPHTGNGAGERSGARIQTQPVRSGQQIYARGTDLIVMTTVSPGAEVIADGCIHVYGALRGRALAGARGREDARIFCRSLEAELIAVAGQYRVAEDIRENVRKQAVQVFLEGETLRIEPLGE
jgi:septum site-determining protein MinC